MSKQGIALISLGIIVAALGTLGRWVFEKKTAIRFFNTILPLFDSVKFHFRPLILQSDLVGNYRGVEFLVRYDAVDGGTEILIRCEPKIPYSQKPKWWGPGKWMSSQISFSVAGLEFRSPARWLGKLKLKPEDVQRKMDEMIEIKFQLENESS